MTTTVDTEIHDDPEEQPAVTLDPLARLAREVRAAAVLIEQDQARFLVGLYYDLQEHRLALTNQDRSLVAAERPADIVHHFADQMYTLERQMVSVLDPFTMASEVGRWSRAQVGIGPILAAGLLAHIDIERAPTVGHIWSFFGQVPGVVWAKGERRPWNADGKVICWRIGDSFCKSSTRPNSFYGPIYRARKELEVERNDSGTFAEQAATSLATRNIKDADLKKTYEAGRLPAGRLELRARRYAVKLFLAGWHEVAYVERYGQLPPKPYILEHGDGQHVHEIVPPHLPDSVVALRRAAGRPTEPRGLV